MKKMPRVSKFRKAVFLLPVLGLILLAFGVRNGLPLPGFNKLNKKVLAETIGHEVSQGRLPSEYDFAAVGLPGAHQLDYGINTALQEQTQKLLNQYRPDYGALVAIEPRTGKIVTLVQYVKEPEVGLEHIALRGTFPSASVFKLVTAAAAINERKLSPKTVIPFNGRASTLYRRNVSSEQVNRWTQFITLQQAFAHSVNGVFGKIGMFYLGKDRLEDYAKRFGFNKEIPADLPYQHGRVAIDADDDWQVAESAAGFTLNTTMSPLHGALLAAAVANNGIMMEPYLVESVRDAEGSLVYEPEPTVASVVVDSETASELRDMMKETVRHGTSTRSFRDLLRSHRFEEIEVGGKTGSLTGKDPSGKCDWFVGYSKFNGQWLAFAALTVHKKYWTVKSAYLIRKYVEYYYLTKNEEPKVYVSRK